MHSWIRCTAGPTGFGLGSCPHSWCFSPWRESLQILADGALTDLTRMNYYNETKMCSLSYSVLFSLTCAIVLWLCRNQGFGLGLDLIQPAVQLPLVGGGGLRLEEDRNNFINISAHRRWRVCIILECFFWRDTIKYKELKDDAWSPTSTIFLLHIQWNMIEIMNMFSSVKKVTQTSFIKIVFEMI